MPKPATDAETTAPRFQLLHVRVPIADLDALRALAESEALQVADVVRRAVRQYLAATSE